jgi:nucleotide-binding universal stress UspA family protein
MASPAGTRTIVVGVDGSENSERALAWAIDDAKLRGAKLCVVTAWHVAGYAHVAPGFVPILGSPIDEPVEETARKIAETAAKRARDAGIDTEVVVRDAQPADMLVESAKRLRAQLLVVGSRGLGGFGGLLLGSVGQQVAHHAPCPVVIVR